MWQLLWRLEALKIAYYIISFSIILSDTFSNHITDCFHALSLFFWFRQKQHIREKKAHPPLLILN